jgi:hypothetical protein
MSIFNTDTIEQSGDWAIEQAYNISEWPCLVCRRPRYIINKDSERKYCTVYDLWVDYLDDCHRLDYFENILRKAALPKGSTHNCYPRHNRKAFIAYVRKECSEVVIYKETQYFSWDWYCKNIRDDISKTYNDFLIQDGDIHKY